MSIYGKYISSVYIGYFDDIAANASLIEEYSIHAKESYGDLILGFQSVKSGVEKINWTLGDLLNPLHWGESKTDALNGLDDYLTVLNGIWSYWNEVSDDFGSNTFLSGGKVSPGTASEGTQFSFLVDYLDRDGYFPSSAKVYIDDFSHTMNRISGSSADGTYRYQTTALETGNHNYYFEFISGQGTAVRFPSSGTFSGPAVDVEPFGDLVIDSPPNNPYETGDSSVKFVLRVPDGTDYVIWYNSLTEGDDRFTVDSDDEWDDNVDVDKGRNVVTFRAYDSGDNLLASTVGTVIRKDNVRTVIFSSQEWAFVGSGRPTKNYGGSEVAVRYDRYDDAPEYELEVMRGLVKFNLDLPGGSEVQSA